MAIDKTVRAYDEHARSWAASHSEPLFWADEMTWLRAALPQSSRLIEFGAGPGRDGIELARLYRYTGLDASAAMIELARERAPHLCLWHMDMRTMGLPEGIKPFDGFWAAAVLLHIPEAEIDSVMDNMRAMLNTDAIGFIAVKDGEGTEEYASADVPSARFFQYWSRGGFTAVLGRCGFEVLRYEFRQAGATGWHRFLVRSCKPL